MKFSTQVFFSTYGKEEFLAKMAAPITAWENDRSSVIERMCWIIVVRLTMHGLSVIYNLDKKTLTKMNEELAARKEVASNQE